MKNASLILFRKDAAFPLAQTQLQHAIGEAGKGNALGRVLNSEALDSVVGHLFVRGNGVFPVDAPRPRIGAIIDGGRFGQQLAFVEKDIARLNGDALIRASDLAGLFGYTTERTARQPAAPG